MGGTDNAGSAGPAEAAGSDGCRSAGTSGPMYQASMVRMPRHDHQ